jgi:single-strand DNA-binding protein
MASINKCIFIGNVSKVETRYMPNSDAVTNFTIAINETWKNKDGVKQERVEWINCVAYRKLGEICGEFMKVGMPVYVEGKVQTRQFEKDGQKRYVTEIIIDQMQMLGSKQDNSSQSDSAQSKRYSTPGDPGGFDSMDDSIPF